MKRVHYNILVYFLFIISYCACKETNTHPNNDATKKIQTKEDSAYNETIRIHDEVMPKMGKLIGYEKKAQHQLDSIVNRMEKNELPGMQELKQKMESLLTQLKMAEKGMNDWMQGFDPEPKLPTTEERIAYFLDQKIKAQKMKDDFFAALDSAKQILENDLLKR